MKKKMPHYKRAGIVSIQEVTSIYNKSEGRHTFIANGKKINIGMRSLRYKTFTKLGTVCVSCGVEGAFYAIEKDKGKGSNYHLNLYAIKENGTEILMTRDHIIPKSKGGKNHISNMQPMCCKCNEKKGNTYEC